jgi:hypothetical protein
VRAGELCDVNGDQGCETGECIDGYCGGPPACTEEGDDCGNDEACCDELVCTDGVCATAAPDDGDGEGDGDGGGTEGPETGGGDTGGETGGDDVPTVLPTTGTGDRSAQSPTSLLVTGSAAAAALIAAKRLRAPSGASEENEG